MRVELPGFGRRFSRLRVQGSGLRVQGSGFRVDITSVSVSPPPPPPRTTDPPGRAEPGVPPTLPCSLLPSRPEKPSLMKRPNAPSSLGGGSAGRLPAPFPVSEAVSPRRSRIRSAADPLSPPAAGLLPDLSLRREKTRANVRSSETEVRSGSVSSSCTQGSGFRVQGSGCRVQGSGCRVQGAGFRVQGSGCRVQGSGLSDLAS